MAYLIAAIIMTLSVVEGHSLIASFFQVQYFIFMVRHAVSLHLQSFLLLSVKNILVALCS